VDTASVQAQSVGWDEEPGKLSKIGIDESQIKPENRVPRVTTANWSVHDTFLFLSIGDLGK
jgi:hypothetical protein